MEASPGQPYQTQLVPALFHRVSGVTSSATVPEQPAAASAEVEPDVLSAAEDEGLVLALERARTHLVRRRSELPPLPR
jgi:hypothetical protein